MLSTLKSTVRLREVSTGRIAGFDLESRPIAFWIPERPAAEITAFAWKWTDERKAWSMLLGADGRFTVSFGNDETEVLDGDAAYRRFVDVLTEAALVFGHNIRTFDLPLLNAGLLRREIPPLGSLLTTDTLRDYPKRRDMSASLENLAAMYGLDRKGKLHMSTIAWEQANRLTPEGVTQARARVVSDVLLQERLRGKLLELGLLKAPKRWSP